MRAFSGGWALPKINPSSFIRFVPKIHAWNVGFPQRPLAWLMLQCSKPDVAKPGHIIEDRTGGPTAGQGHI